MFDRYRFQIVRSTNQSCKTLLKGKLLLSSKVANAAEVDAIIKGIVRLRKSTIFRRIVVEFLEA